MKLLKKFIPLLALPFLTSCTLPQQPTGNIGGAAIGAGIGAGSMALFAANKPFILLGGIVGAGLGYYATTLRFAAGPIVQACGQVYTLGDYVGIEIPTDRLFEDNTACFLPEAGPILASTVDIVQRFPCHNIIISGSTSGFGPSRYERKLSEQRARQVASYLWANGVNDFKAQSIDMRRLTYVGYGNHFPIANNIKNNSIRKNSRIQIILFPSIAPTELTKDCSLFNNIGAYSDHTDYARCPNQPSQLPMDFSKIFPPKPN